MDYYLSCCCLAILQRRKNVNEAKDRNNKAKGKE